ncbi:MAG: SRPBCC domain-containing protein [Thermoplasmata archaeon]|nr:SRPBCC domain-containing protein [Thermoplasmata archaeon]
MRGARALARAEKTIIRAAGTNATVFDEPDPILIQVTVQLPPAFILAGFTDPKHLTQWLCAEADVEPRVGGRYDLTFTEEAAFTSHGTVTRLTPDIDVGFTWEAPPEFAAFMNGPPPVTGIYVRLQDSPEGVDVTLEHTGWKNGDGWGEARSWHFHLWDDRLHRFKDYLLKAAYG